MQPLPNMSPPIKLPQHARRFLGFAPLSRCQTRPSEVINNLMGLIPVGMAAYFTGEVGSMVALH